MTTPTTDLAALSFPVAPAGVEWSEYHLAVIDTSAPLERLSEFLDGAVRLSDAARFWIGDLLLFADARYGEEGQIEALGLSHDQAERYRLVCERIVRSRRKEWAALADAAGFHPSWSHFRLLARLKEPEEQTGWFKRLLSERWSTRDLDENLRNAQALREAGNAQISDTRPKSTVAVVDAARAVGEVSEVVALADRALNGEDVAQEIADRLPRAAAAAKEMGKFVKDVGVMLSLRDAALRLREAAVRQSGLADPAYIVPSKAFEEFLAALEEAE